MEIYGYAVEVLNKCHGVKGGDYWTRYRRKIYNSEEVARKAFEENPYKHSESGFMADYRIITLYFNPQRDEPSNI
jgi:hypothetical protein